MAVENTNLQSDLYDGDGVTTTFNAQFTFILNTDVKVIVLEADGETETVLTLTTDYTVNFVGDSGEIVLVAPLASGKKIRIVSNIPPIQPYEFPLGNKFPADRVEAALDRVTLVSQRVLSELMRTVSLPATSLITNLELPDGGASRLGYVWRWNAVDGNTLEAVSPVEVVFGDSLSNYMKTFLANSDSASARGTLGLGTLATQSGTFSGTSSGTNTGDQVAFTTIAVASQSDVVADSTSDTLTLVAGSNVTITTDAASDTITIAATGGGGGGDVVSDTTPQLGGNLDVNGFGVTSPDTTDKILIPNGTINLQTNSVSRVDITDSGLRMGGANARVTTILDQDTMSSNSDTALATQQSIKAYVDANASALVKISAVTPTGVASVAFTGLSGTYKHYKLIGTVTPATDGVNLCLRTSSNNGSSYDSGASDYYQASQNSTSGTSTNAAVSAVLLTGDGSSTVGNASGEGVSFELTLYNPATTGYTRAFTTATFTTPTPIHVNQFTSLTRQSVGTVNAINLYFSSGNIASGILVLYGVKG